MRSDLKPIRTKRDYEVALKEVERGAVEFDKTICGAAPTFLRCAQLRVRVRARNFLRVGAARTKLTAGR
jgi:hypothetical protein